MIYIQGCHKVLKWAALFLEFVADFAIFFLRNQMNCSAV